MSEKTSMNQGVIEVKLFDNKGADTLLFSFPDTGDDIYVNLNETSSQKDLKEVFGKLLEILYSKDIQLKLVIDEKYKKGLYKEVCIEYIEDLNKEIRSIRSEIQKAVSE